MVKEEKISSHILKKLVTLGKKKGYLTRDGLNEALPPKVIASREIDDILIALEKKGIAVRDVEEKPAPLEKLPPGDFVRSTQDSTTLTFENVACLSGGGAELEYLVKGDNSVEYRENGMVLEVNKLKPTK